MEAPVFGLAVATGTRIADITKLSNIHLTPIFFILNDMRLGEFIILCSLVYMLLIVPINNTCITGIQTLSDGQTSEA